MQYSIANAISQRSYRLTMRPGLLSITVTGLVSLDGCLSREALMSPYAIVLIIEDIKHELIWTANKIEGQCQLETDSELTEIC